MALQELGRLVGRGLASHLGEHRVCHGAPKAHTAEPKSQVQDTHRPLCDGNTVIPIYREGAGRRKCPR